jgi:hypothetical protein
MVECGTLALAGAAAGGAALPADVLALLQEACRRGQLPGLLQVWPATDHVACMPGLLAARSCSGATGNSSKVACLCLKETSKPTLAHSARPPLPSPPLPACQTLTAALQAVQQQAPARRPKQEGRQQPAPGPLLLQLQALVQQALLAQALPPHGVPPGARFAGRFGPDHPPCSQEAGAPRRSAPGGCLALRLGGPTAPPPARRSRRVPRPPAPGAEAVRYAEAATLALAALAAQEPRARGAPQLPAAPLLRLLSPAGASQLEELRRLGKGGFGSVLAVRSRLDGRWATLAQRGTGGGATGAPKHAHAWTWTAVARLLAAGLPGCQ